jgi:hypothetical protein
VFAPSKGREPEEFSAVSHPAALRRVSEQYGLPYPIPVVQFLDRGFLRVEQITPQGPKRIFPLLA